MIKTDQKRKIQAIRNTKLKPFMCRSDVFEKKTNQKICIGIRPGKPSGYDRSIVQPPGQTEQRHVGCIQSPGRLPLYPAINTYWRCALLLYSQQNLTRAFQASASYNAQFKKCDILTGSNLLGHRQHQNRWSAPGQPEGENTRCTCRKQTGKQCGLHLTFASKKSHGMRPLRRDSKASDRVFNDWRWKQCGYWQSLSSP
jgi:hypothetical protein